MEIGGMGGSNGGAGVDGGVGTLDGGEEDEVVESGDEGED